MQKKVSDKCDKCKSTLLGGEIFTEGGEVYSLCKLCSKVIHSFAETGMITWFMKDHKGVEKKMLDARIRRANGGSAW